MTLGSRSLLYDNITVTDERMKKNKDALFAVGPALRLTHWTLCSLAKTKASHIMPGMFVHPLQVSVTWMLTMSWW